MNDEDYAFFWGILVGVFFTIVGQKVWATWDIPALVNNILRGAS